MPHRTALAALAAIALAACAAPQKQADSPEMGHAPDRASGETILEQYAATNRFRNGAPSSISFTPDGDAALYLRSGPRDRVRDLYELDLATGEETRLVTAGALLGGEAETLTAEERARRERARDTGRGLSSFSLSPDGDQLLLPLSGRLFVFDRVSGEHREIGSEHAAAIDARFSPDASMIAAVRDGDLYLTDVATGDERRLTTSDHPRVTHGAAEFIAQEEMGRRHGYWWAPDSTSILYQRTDTRDVVTFRIMDPANPGEPPREWPYPRAGTNNADVTLHLQDLETGDIADVAWDRERYPYLATVKWPEDAPLTLVVQNRAQTESAVLTADPDTGETMTLHVETNDDWIDLDQSVPRWIEGGEAFLWSTERNGDWQLEVRDATGDLRSALTAPTHGYTGLLGVDERAGRVYYSARLNQINTHVAEAPIDPAEGRPKLLTEGRGLFSATLADDASLLALRGERPSGERVSEIRTPAGDRLASLPDLRESPARPIDAEFVTIAGARAFHCSIVRPASFDPDKTYPVIVRVYGGPTSVMVRPSATAMALDRWLADRGFIVVRTDGRGTPGRGSDWLRAVKHDFISAPLDDLGETVTLLTERYPEMDPERVGVFGWSWGGYFAAMAATRRPDVFAAAVAGAPVVDWLDYDTHYTERYMGVPGTEHADYHASSVLADADNLRTPLMLIHGTADDNVYFTHSTKLAEALIRADKPFEFLPLPGVTHSPTDAEIVVPLYRRIAEFFTEELAAD